MQWVTVKYSYFAAASIDSHYGDKDCPMIIFTVHTRSPYTVRKCYLPCANCTHF